jgi:GTP-binding protein
MKMGETDSADKFMVLVVEYFTIICSIETMRRENYKLSNHKLLYKEIDGKKCEPIEELTIDLPPESFWKSCRICYNVRLICKGMVIKFNIPSRGISGLQSIVDCYSGEAIMSQPFHRIRAFKGAIPGRNNGSLISMENGKAIPYSIDKLQDRGKFFVNPNDEIYEGQVIGEM